MHCRFEKTYFRPPGAFASSTSWDWTTTKVLAESLRGFCSPRPGCSAVFSAGRSFHCLQVTWHERHPMHFVVSMRVALDMVVSSRAATAARRPPLAQIGRAHV